MTKPLPTHLVIRYRGKLHGTQWIYHAPKTVELPIPFIARSEKIGEVLCDPCGTFSYEDGMKLIGNGDGPFILEKEIYSEATEPEKPEPEVGPGTSKIAASANYTPSRTYQLHRRKRGRPASKKQKATAIPDNPQAAVEAESAPSPA